MMCKLMKLNKKKIARKKRRNLKRDMEIDKAMKETRCREWQMCVHSQKATKIHIGIMIHFIIYLFIAKNYNDYFTVNDLNAVRLARFSSLFHLLSIIVKMLTTMLLFFLVHRNVSFFFYWVTSSVHYCVVQHFIWALPEFQPMLLVIMTI